MRLIIGMAMGWQTQEAFHLNLPATSNLKVTVEGIIGAGKTHLIQHIGKINKDFCIFPEPIVKWTEKDNLLKEFYMNPKERAIKLQEAVNDSLLRRQQIINASGQNCLIERSLDAGQFVFQKALYELGFLTKQQNAKLDLWHENARQSCPFQPNLVIYLRIEPERALRQIRLRNREGEEHITLEYLNTLQRLHDEWLNNLHGPRIFTINGVPTKQKITAEFNKHSDDIKRRVESLNWDLSTIKECLEEYCEVIEKN